uniref:HNH nuclease domain-containing protein n=1 Tax=Mycena chlorophos TaxID=658473 RepID=A0ABQ0LK23_MYCCL|nr:predicted protein [Mycena chlorophos]
MADHTKSTSAQTSDTDVPEQTVYPFLVPKLAQERDANVFVFGLESYPTVVIRAALNSRLHNLTGKMLLNWLSSYCETNRIKPSDMSLEKIKIAPTDLFCYAIVDRDGHPIRHDSEAILEPGLYGIFSKEKKPFLRVVGPREEAVLNEIPAELRQRALERSGGRCEFTGTLDKVQACWVFPPSAAYNIYLDDPIPYHKYQVLANVTIVASQLVEAFLTNKFSVDIEDGGRIIIFEKLAPNAPMLPTHLPTLPPLADRRFWRLSFRHTLQHRLPVGHNAAADFEEPEYDGQQWMAELSENPNDLRDKKWATPFGQEIIRIYRTRQENGGQIWMPMKSLELS